MALKNVRIQLAKAHAEKMYFIHKKGTDQFVHGHVKAFYLKNGLSQDAFMLVKERAELFIKVDPSFEIICAADILFPKTIIPVSKIHKIN